jgi:hypothetical protein
LAAGFELAECPVLQLGLIGIHSVSVALWRKLYQSAPDPPSWRIHPARPYQPQAAISGCAYACRIRIKYAISKASGIDRVLDTHLNNINRCVLSFNSAVLACTVMVQAWILLRE